MACERALCHNIAMGRAFAPRRGELCFDAHCIDGHRVKTRIAMRSNGTVTLETTGRGKAALRRLEQLQGEKLMQLVNQSMR
jgi:hypothetical protein